jgi:hypothetical protein
VVSNPRTALVALLLAILSVAIDPAASAKKPGGGGGPSSSSAFVKSYSNLSGTTQFSVSPEDVQTTSDGGYIALGTTQSATTGVGVSWLVKLPRPVARSGRKSSVAWALPRAITQTASRSCRYPTAGTWSGGGTQQLRLSPLGS